MEHTVDLQLTYDFIAWRHADLRQVQEAWDYLASTDTRSPIFHRREWFELGSRTGAIQPRGVLLINTDRPIALFPLQRCFPGCWECVSLFGQGEMQVLIDPAHEELAWQGVAQWMRHTPSVGLLTLGVTEHRNWIDQLTTACRQHGLVIAEKQLPTPAVWSELPGSWETFLQRIGSTSARNIRRAEKKLHELGEEYSVEVYTTPEECARQIPALVRLYRKRWQHEAVECQFSNPANVRFYEEAIRWAAWRGCALVYVFRLRGEPFLVQTLFCEPGKAALYQHFTARDVEALPNSYSPGVAGSAQQFRWAIEHGMTRVNQGPVNMSYKSIFDGVEHPRWKVAIARSSIHHSLLGSCCRSRHIIQHLPAYAMIALHHLLQGKTRKRKG